MFIYDLWGSLAISLVETENVKFTDFLLEFFKRFVIASPVVLSLDQELRTLQKKNSIFNRIKSGFFKKCPDPI